MSKKEYIYGFHAVRGLLLSQPKTVKQVLLLKNRRDARMQEIMNLADEHSIGMQTLSRDQIEQLMDKDDNHQGVVAECSSSLAASEDYLKILVQETKEPMLFLVLDGVQDPHNLGACLRSANAFGVQAVIAPKDKASGITPVVRKVACGAVGATPFVQVTNLSRTLRWLKEQGVWLAGTSDHGNLMLREIDMTGHIALIMGREGQGMRQLTEKQCDFLAKIPMSGSVESLNVSVATGVCLYEVQRQRY
jgi:23S rRNA (guanosine2251-2'-O)-methyltransferase